MISELRTFRIRCDGCGHSRVMQESIFVLPDDWGVREVGPCGLTNYYRTEHLCPACKEKHEREQQQSKRAA